MAVPCAPLRHLGRHLLLPVLLAPVLLVGCSGGSTPAVAPDVAASAPLPGVTLPPGDLVDLVPRPEEVPAGMVPLLSGSGPRTLEVVAGYSGTGEAVTAAAASLTSHGFVGAYVAQYANQATAQSVTVLVSEFEDAAGATADLAADLASPGGKVVATPTLGEQSRVTVQNTPGTAPGATSGELVLARFRRGVHTWLVTYSAVPTADPDVAISLSGTLLTRTSA